MIHLSTQHKDLTDLIKSRIKLLRSIITKRQTMIKSLPMEEDIKRLTIKEIKQLKQTEHITKLIRYKESINARYKEREELKRLLITPLVYGKFMKAYYRHVQKDLLMGEETFISSGLGTLRVYQVRRQYHRAKKRVDWDKSLYVLEHIASEQAPHLLEAYKGGKLKKPLFIDAMKKYVYSEEHPKKPKWIVEQANDIIPFANFYCHPRVRGGKYYVFVPTNYCNTLERSQVAFTDSISHKDEIIDSIDLGTRDKLFALCRYDSEHLQRFIPIKYR